MNTDSTSMAHIPSAQETDAAMHAMTDRAKAENLGAVAALSDAANDAHIAEHIRGIVAVTMGHLAINAAIATRANAERWQDWALGVADGGVHTAPAGV